MRVELLQQRLYRLGPRLHHQGKSSSWPSLACARGASQRLHDVMRMLFLLHCMLTGRESQDIHCMCVRVCRQSTTSTFFKPLANSVVNPQERVWCKKSRWSRWQKPTTTDVELCLLQQVWPAQMPCAAVPSRGINAINNSPRRLGRWTGAGFRHRTTPFRQGKFDRGSPASDTTACVCC